MTYDRATSPIGWYVGSYLLRFIEQNAEGNDDLEKKFLVWENTILVEAASFEAAYAKLCEFAARETKPYKGGTALRTPLILHGFKDLGEDRYAGHYLGEAFNEGPQHVFCHVRD